MKVSNFDFNRAKALFFLLEEAHVGRAAAELGITAAAASNALRRLREDFGDPLLVRRGRGLIRTRVGEILLEPARGVIAATNQLLQANRPFEPASFDGELPIALAEHVAAMLIAPLDALARDRAPRAKLMVSPIPLDIIDWLKRSGGVLAGPAGPFAATQPGDDLIAEDYYAERYVCVMRSAHPLAQLPLTMERYAAQNHVLVLPRGLTAKSNIDVFLESKGLARRIVRTVPSFSLAVPLILQSDLLTTMPERTARRLSSGDFSFKEMPIIVPPLVMKLLYHPAHKNDGRSIFMRRLLLDALPKSG